MKNIFANLTRKEAKNYINFLNAERVHYMSSSLIQKQGRYQRTLYAEIFDYLIAAFADAYKSDEEIKTQKKEVPFYLKETLKDIELKELIGFFKQTLKAFKESAKILDYEKEYIRGVKRKYRLLIFAFKKLKRT